MGDVVEWEIVFIVMVWDKKGSLAYLL